MIVLRNVVKTYATGKQALSGITLTVPRNDFVFLVGGNGAGKSTLLKLLIRAEVATAGVVIVAGHDLRLLPESRVPAFRQQIGIVFQDIRLFPEKTLFENVAFSLQVSGQPRRGKTKELVMEALDLVGLAAYAHRFPHQVSGGEQQRAAIARAIVRAPPLLIADEPTANLPPDVAWQLVQLLGEINRRGVTVVMATHDREVVDGMKRRVVELVEGRIIRDQRYGTFTPSGTAPAASGGAALSGASTALTPTSSSALYPVVPPAGPNVLAALPSPPVGHTAPTTRPPAAATPSGTPPQAG
jgi:cell division transport system ATP-binding protein